MTKQEILEYFDDINFAYNDCSRHDSLSIMLDKLTDQVLEEIKAEIEQLYIDDGAMQDYTVDSILELLDKHIGKEQE